MRPFVVQPQIKNVKANAQKALVLLASRKTRRLPITEIGAASGTSFVGTQPSGLRPTFSGLSRKNIKKTAAIKSEKQATITEAVFQPDAMSTIEISGRKTSDPVA